MKLAISNNGAVNRHRATKRKSSNNVNKNPWLWILSGILVGILISSTVFVKFNFNTQNIAPVKQKLKNIEQKANFAATKAAPKEKEPVFDFYTVLPNMDPKTTNTMEKQKSPTVTNLSSETTSEVKNKSIKNIKYFLQVATFNKMEAADALKAELTLAGFDTNIELSQKNNKAWYRIVMGPFNSEQQARKQQQLLAKQNLQGNLFKIEQ